MANSIKVEVKRNTGQWALYTGGRYDNNTSASKSRLRSVLESAAVSPVASGREARGVDTSTGEVVDWVSA